MRTESKKKSRPKCGRKASERRRARPRHRLPLVVPIGVPSHPCSRRPTQRVRPQGSRLSFGGCRAGDASIAPASNTADRLGRGDDCVPLQPRCSPEAHARYFAKRWPDSRCLGFDRCCFVAGEYSEFWTRCSSQLIHAETPAGAAGLISSELQLACQCLKRPGVYRQRRAFFLSARINLARFPATRRLKMRQGSDQQGDQPPNQSLQKAAKSIRPFRP